MEVDIGVHQALELGALLRIRVCHLLDNIIEGATVDPALLCEELRPAHTEAIAGSVVQGPLPLNLDVVRDQAGLYDDGVCAPAKVAEPTPRFVGRLMCLVQPAQYLVRGQRMLCQERLPLVVKHLAFLT